MAERWKDNAQDDDCQILGARNCSQRENGNGKTLKPGDGRLALITMTSGGHPSPQMVTLSLYRKLLSAVPVGSNDRLFAEVEWGTGGGKNFARVDFVHGQRLSLTASSLTVSAIYGTNNVDVALAGPDCFVSAEIIYGSVGTNNAQFTDQAVSVGAGITSTPLPIPDFARELQLFDNVPAATAPTTYDIIFSTENPVGARFVRIPAVTAGVPTGADRVCSVPIPNGFDFYSITNLAAAGRLVFPVFKLFL